MVVRTRHFLPPQSSSSCALFFFRILHLAAVQCAWVSNKQSLHRLFERDAKRVEPHLLNGQLVDASVCASATGVIFHSKL